MIRRLMVLAAGVALCAFGAVGCERDTTTDRVEIEAEIDRPRDDTLDRVGEDLERGAERTGEAIERTAEDIRESVQD